MKAGYSIVVFWVACAITSLTALADETTRPTQGQLALALAQKLGYQNSALTENSAVEWLARLGIKPGAGPSAQWSASAPATSKVVAEIQASLQLLLKDVAAGLSITPPPTLDLYVFELPPAPQKAGFPHNECPQQVDAKGKNTPPPAPTSPLDGGSIGPSGQVNGVPLPLTHSPRKMEQSPSQKFLGRVVGRESAAETDDAVVSAMLSSNGGEVPVIIELRTPAKNQPNLPADAALIAATQKAVLASLTPSDFRLKHQYESIFALSGWVSQAGLQKLQRHPAVQAIRLDAVAKPLGSSVAPEPGNGGRTAQ